MTELIERGQVYRFFDNRDELLYVGVTRDLGTRIAAHRRSSPWWAEAARAEVVFYDSMAAARAAEAAAIVAERPRYNVSQPTPDHVVKLHERAGTTNNDGLLRATAEVERLRRLSGDQYVKLVGAECERDRLARELSRVRDRLSLALDDGRRSARLLDEIAAERRAGAAVSRGADS